jgi:S-adenosylmethionine:tRNA ribosyltransferase-isomerase
MIARLAENFGLIEATEPPEYRGLARDEVRLLATDRRAGQHRHARFLELPSLLRHGDLVIVNDSQTLPAALTATRANGTSIAVHVSTMIDERLWLVEPRGRVAAGETLSLPAKASATMLTAVDPERPRLWYSAFDLPAPMTPYLLRVGEPIRYAYAGRRFPLSDYQTIFGRVPGSAEMPSAARPFSPRTLTALRERGVQVHAITLHCGVASFEAPERPGIERFIVTHATAQAINAARREGRRVIAVGTTVVRALESAVRDGELIAAAGWTDLVVDESHRVVSVDGLLTGFHDATATHLWMLRAFLKSGVLEDAYNQAAAGGYHYHEFGDVHLIM